MEMKKSSPVIGFAVTVVLVAVDQLTKMLAELFLAGNRAVSLIPGVFQLYYLQNRGAAFGMFSGKQMLFVGMAVLMLALSAYTYCRLPGNAHYDLLRLVCVLIASGAVGNMIDRLLRGYVTDFLYFSLIDFPVFNVADCYVCIGAAVLALALFTRYKEDDFHFLLPERNRKIE